MRFARKRNSDRIKVFLILTKVQRVSLGYLSKKIMNLEKEKNIVNTMFNGTDYFYVAESDINDTISSTSGFQIQATVLITQNSYNETN